MNMTLESDCIGVTCTRLRHFADTFSQWNSCWKIKTVGHMAENKSVYQMHIFVTSLSSQHAPVWRCFCMVQPLRQPFRPKCTNRILQMHHQNPVVPPESGVHPQNPVCTYSVKTLMAPNAIHCHSSYIDYLAQDCNNSSALAMDYCSLALSHRYEYAQNPGVTRCHIYPTHNDLF